MEPLSDNRLPAPLPWGRYLARAACLALTFVLALCAGGLTHAQSVGIAAVVNDSPISAWDVDQRMRFYQSTGTPGSAEALGKRALDELINEALMTQEASRVGVSVDDADVRRTIEARLEPLKRTFSQFRQYLDGRGIDIATLENQIRARLAWTSVIRRTFGNLISITESDIEEAAGEIDAEDSSSGGDEALVLQRIVLEVPHGSSDTAYAARMEEADRLRELFLDCARNLQILGRFQPVKVEELKDTKASDLDEPARSLVQQARAGQMTPPNLVPSGVEMYAVCERGAANGNRRTAERQLLSQELSLLSDRHLRDLRQDSVVDYR